MSHDYLQSTWLLVIPMLYLNHKTRDNRIYEKFYPITMSIIGERSSLK